MSDLPALISRVAAAQGPDREIDFAVGETVLGLKRCNEELPAGGLCKEVHEADHYTASLDAAVAMVERVLPNANCDGIERLRDLFIGYVGRSYCPDEEQWHVEAEHKTRPLALLLAALRAIEAQGER